MIVVDASVLVRALVDDTARGRVARGAVRDDDHWAAPGHLLFEVISAIRGGVLGGRLDASRGQEAVSSLEDLSIDYVPAERLVERVWALRANVSAYDAAYVAVAETLGCPLVTGDAKLASASGPRCEVRLVAPAEG